MTHPVHYRGYRDAFHGLAPSESGPSYLRGYAAGLRASDRTVTRLVAGSAGSASPAFAPAADVEDDDRPAAGCTLTSLDEGT